MEEQVEHASAETQTKSRKGEKTDEGVDGQEKGKVFGGVGEARWARLLGPGYWGPVPVCHAGARCTDKGYLITFTGSSAESSAPGMVACVW